MYDKCSELNLCPPPCDQKPSFSVIIPVYNAGNSLCSCLESVLASTLNDIEVICINDASSDSSATYLDLYKQKDERIKVISFEENKGCAAARNVGLKEACGKYIGFVDSDDLIERDLLSDIFNHMEKTRSDINIISFRRVAHGQAIPVPDLENFIKKFGSEVQRMNSVEKLTELDDYCWRLAIRRTFWLNHKIYFPEGIHGSEDQCFWKPLELQAERVSFLNCYGYNYHLNPMSLTKRELSSFETVKGIDELMRRLPDEFHLRLMEKCYMRIYRFEMKNEVLKRKLLDEYTVRLYDKANKQGIQGYELPEYEIDKYFGLLKISKTLCKKVVFFLGRPHSEI